MSEPAVATTPVTPESPPRSAGRRVWDALAGGARQLLVPFLALASALLIGAVIIVLSDPEFISQVGSNPGAAFAAGIASVGAGYGGLLSGSLGGVGPISETLLRATPLMLAGLAVALGFRAGLFNIGAEGQIYILSLIHI